MPLDKDKLLKSPVFCMIPWVHLQIEPNGDVKPCCMVPQEFPIGNLKDTNLKAIWNNDLMKELRLNMLNGKKSEMCQRCYEFDELGHINLRVDSINKFTDTNFDVVESTKSDGTVDKFNLKYMDIRFSNVCNFRCRSCGPQLSSRWHADTVKIWPGFNDPVIVRPTEDPEDLWRQIEPLIPYVEEFYFAGGEPLIMEEHYRILKILDDLKLYHVKLRYNTNFSEMKFKGQDVMEIWAKFDSVKVGASLDDSHERGELVRKGQKWSQVEANIERMKIVCPNVEFFVSATFSLMNAWHAPDFHREWVEKGYIGVDDFHTNILLFPNYLRVQVLPQKYKDIIIAKYRDHIDNYLVPLNSERAIGCFESLITFINKEDHTSELKELKWYMGKLDEIRDENLTETFPELRGIFDEV